MAYITYTAIREILAGHTYGSPYSIAFVMQQQDVPRSVNKVVARSLSGKAVSTIRHYDKKWVVKTDFILGTALASAGWDELIASTLNSEGLVFDPGSSTPGAPVNPRNCYVEGEAFPVREGDTPYFSITFTLVEAGYDYF